MLARLARSTPRRSCQERPCALAAKLRPGNVHSAEDWDELLLPEIERQQAAGKQVAFRGTRKK